MKKIILSILTSIPVLINAQSFWNMVEDDSKFNKSHVTDYGLFQDSVILVSGFISDASCHYHKLFAYTLDGQRIWNIGGFHDAIYPDSDYIYSAGYIPIDDVQGSERIVISKHDGAGNNIFHIEFPAMVFDYSLDYKCKNIDIAKDGSILVSANNSIIKSNTEGTKIQEYHFSLGSELEAVFAINEIKYLINSRNKIYTTDSSLVLSDSIHFSDTINKLLIHNDTIYSLFNSKLVRLDSNLNIIDTLFSSIANCQNMEFYDNNLWLQIANADSIDLVNLQESGNNKKQTFPKLTNNTKYIIVDSNFVFIGNSFTNQIGIYNFHEKYQTPNTLEIPDIELVDFVIDNIEFNYEVFEEDTFIIGYRFNTNITIKNNGNDTLHSLAVFSDLHGGINCAQNYFYQTITDIIILPDQEKTVNLKRAYEHGLHNNRLCFECLAPNSSLESQTSDNYLCKTFTITGINHETPSKIKVYPNPIRENFFIESPYFKINSIELIDISGKSIMNKVNPGQIIEVSTYHLKPGIYILKINSGDEIYNQLIMKK